MGNEVAHVKIGRVKNSHQLRPGSLYISCPSPSHRDYRSVSGAVKLKDDHQMWPVSGAVKLKNDHQMWPVYFMVPP